ncbi:SHOCT domain-containing protein [Sedimentitalea nanhaiensis]|uniref:Short C-terminal domain-containing protein n=1 Tax=Sedimentitalea nanhaiensis TaxID=999627 RepID=A0A1I6ZX38_9RHOB|nr:SHOCT domain-containing protein [Sedimentitalea nanhaiensis]SFT67195.1 Short C-terminal domain-containing protein [Sedimentitalea nanhaiensis]
MKRIAIGSLLILSLIAVSACSGGGAKTTNTISTATTGQELTDLKAALDAGAITESEYEKKRKEILKRKG